MWRHYASRRGQTAVQQPFTIRRVSKPRGGELPLHAHAEAQLTFAASGMVQVHTDNGVWLVPPQLAAWIPPGASHRIDIISDADLWIVMWEQAAVQKWAPRFFPDRAFASRVSPLLRSLLDEAVKLDANSGKAELIVRLMLHELTEMQDAPTFLPIPKGAVGRRVADIALTDIRNDLGIADLATRAATSIRTVSRTFPLETGMTLKAWRQRARVVWTMEQLARGRAIAQVAADAGFSSTAAFSSAFRQVTAMSPTAFLEDAGQ